jgi:hypothetical protein
MWTTVAQSQKSRMSELLDSRDFWFCATVVHIMIWKVFLQCHDSELRCDKQNENEQNP